MKLIRLKINSEFRSLPKGFEVHFLRDFNFQEATKFNPYILAGLNGSGKSNVLEVLSEIFYHLDCIYLSNKPNYFDKSQVNKDGFDSSKGVINSYELEYFTFLDKNVFFEVDCEEIARIKVTKRSGKRPVIFWENEDLFRKPKELSRLESKSLLPEYVVAYASGDNQTLSIPFFKSRFLQYDEYTSFLKDGAPIEPKPESSLIYLDNNFSQAILLTNFLMQDDEKGLLRPFKDFVKIEKLDSFRLVLKTNTKLNVSGGFDNSFSDEFESSMKIDLMALLTINKGDKSLFDQSYIDKLKSCATSWNNLSFHDVYRKDDDVEEYFDDSEYLILDYKVNKATKDAFQFHFENNPLKLFELFQLLLILDNNELSVKEKVRAYNSKNLFIVNDIDHRPKEADRILRFKDLYIEKEGVNKPIFTKSLSDGEHQFLHSIGLSLLFKDSRTLFLLDEPETHFNPDWKAKFISSLRESFDLEIKDKNLTMREMIITTHSPFLISDSKQEYVQIFSKNPKTGKVLEPMRPNFQTLGTSINSIGVKIFKMPNTIGEYAQKVLATYREEFKQLRKDQDKNLLILKIKNNLGESVERVLLINEIIESMNPEV